MESKIRFDLSKFVSDLEHLGVKVTTNSNKPGFFNVSEEGDMELNAQDIFPEFKRLASTSGQFHVDEVEVNTVRKFEVKLQEHLFTDLTVGAA